MRNLFLSLACITAIATALPAQTTTSTRSAPTPDKNLPRAEWGAPDVKVSQSERAWTIAGKKQSVTLNAADLALRIRTHQGGDWSMVPSGPNDLLVKSGGEEFFLRLADARAVEIRPYDTGYKTGVQIVLADFRSTGMLTRHQPVDLVLYLTLALEGADEDLAFDVAADERGAKVRRLDWPTALDAREIDYTALPNVRGCLLPRDWPKAYHPIRSSPDLGGGSKPADTSEVQSNVIESWSMSWWGFARGTHAMATIIETPDDAAYQFDHPAGGPTVIGPRWRDSLGALRYPRAGRMCFMEGTYVDMAMRYRKHAIDTGLFVSLKEKIARNPAVKDLIGTPLTRSGILTNIVPTSLRYSTTQPERNFRLVTFDERAAQYRQLKQAGLDRLHVCLTGWPNMGYDRQHPDELPPAPIAGGWDGMKRLSETCRELGYLLSLHDQYRDYYTDAPSFDRRFAVHEEDARTPSTAFPGSRFGQWKDGNVPFMNNWDGGHMAYLNNRFMPGHLRKNYAALAARGIRLNGTYLDVFGYVPPDEDFNPEHPCTRSDAIRARAECYNWVRANVGFVGTEAACDWTLPYADVSSPLRSNRAVPVPLFNLAFHDAIITTYDPSDLHGFLNAGLPQISLSGRGGNSTEAPSLDPAYLKKTRRLAALHERLALVPMTKHEFLGAERKKECATYGDGTTVTVDWAAGSVAIAPDVDVKE